MPQPYDVTIFLDVRFYTTVAVSAASEAEARRLIAAQWPTIGASLGHISEGEGYDWEVVKSHWQIAEVAPAEATEETPSDLPQAPR